MSDDPVEEAAEGTAEETSEESAAESIEESAGADEIADDAEGDDSEAEDEPSAKGQVKYSRFRSVNERRKQAEAEVAALKAQIATMSQREEVVSKGPSDRIKKILKPAPATMTALEQMEYYGVETMRAHMPELFDEIFEKRFGMKPDQAGATLSHATTSTRDNLLRQWEESAKAAGLDPRNQTLRNAVGAVMDSGAFSTFAEAISVFRPQAAKKVEPRKIGKNGAEVESVDLSGLSRVKALPRTKEEAMKLAAANKRIEHASLADILRATQSS